MSLQRFIEEGYAVSEQKVLSDQALELVRQEIQRNADSNPSSLNTLDHDQLLSDQEMEIDYPESFKLQQLAKNFARPYVGQETQILQNQLVIREHRSDGLPAYHIDGNRMIANYPNWDSLPLFKGIVGIALVDMNTADIGNLVVLPGMHHQIAQYLYENWPELRALDKHQAFRQVFSYIGRQDLTSEKPILVKAGHAYILHALMPHRTLTNTSGSKRPIWYFRLGTCQLKGREAYKTACPLQDWPTS